MAVTLFVVTERDYEEALFSVIGAYPSIEQAKQIVRDRKKEIFNDPMYQPWECCEEPDESCVDNLFFIDINRCIVNGIKEDK